MYFLRIELDQQVEAHTAVCRENVMRLLIGVIIVLFLIVYVFTFLIVLHRAYQYGLIVEIIFRLPIYS